MIGSWMGNLSLQQKAWGIILVSVGLLTLVLSVGMRHILLISFEKLEQDAVVDSVRRLQGAVGQIMDSIDRPNRDNASWNDSYRFAEAPFPEYLSACFSEAIFANLDIHVALVFNHQGKLVAGRTWKKGDTVRPADLASWENVFRPAVLAAIEGQGTAQKGFMRLPGGLAIFSCRPILKDDESGPSNGALIHARYVDADLANKLRYLTNLDIDIHGDEMGLKDPKEADLNLRSEAPVPYRTSGDSMLSFHLPLRDPAGNAVGYIHVNEERSIHLQGNKAIYLLVGAILCIGTIAGLVIIWLLRNLVIGPLEALNSEVSRIGRKADPNARVQAQGTDEIASLANSINLTLDALAKAESQQAVIQQQSDNFQAQLLQAQKMEAIGTMAGGLAHDFNNMLNSIMGSADLMKFELPLNHPAQEHIKRIEKAGSSATALVRQLLAVSRRQSLKLAPIHMVETIEDVLRLLRAGLPKSIQFRFKNFASDDLVLADAAQIHQVVMNMATNSAHALAGREQGFFKITLDETSLPAVNRPETHKLKPGPYLRITLSDNGSGISKENIQHIFEPFFTTKPSGSGSGLGLAVVHGIIAKHNGSISVESEPGKGTTFVIHLPMAPASSRKTESIPPFPQSGGCHILLIDDDRLVRDTIANGMRRMGHILLCTGNAEEALQIVSNPTIRVDAVITDQMMPGMTGLALGAKIQELRPGLPMVLISGYASEMNASEPSTKGFTQVLTKPVSAFVLHETVMSTCRPRKDS